MSLCSCVCVCVLTRVLWRPEVKAECLSSSLPILHVEADSLADPVLSLLPLAIFLAWKASSLCLILAGLTEGCQPHVIFVSSGGPNSSLHMRPVLFSPPLISRCVPSFAVCILELVLHTSWKEITSAKGLVMGQMHEIRLHAFIDSPDLRLTDIIQNPKRL